jgi:hypothetical protein
MTKLFLLLASSLLLLLPSSLAEDCFAGEEEVEFTLFLDEDSTKEQGWTLQCGNDVPLWNVAVGDMAAKAAVGRGSLRNSHYVRNTACVAASTSTCVFTIEDSYGDGLLWPGYYVLQWGATTVAVYDRQPFEEQSYCFGVDCETQPVEVAQEYDDVYFYLKLDANPQETSYQVVCDGGEELLEGGSFDASQAYEEIEVSTIVEPFACCTLTITDSGNDGLNSPEPGFENDYSIYLDWASHQVLAYTAQTGFEFSTLSINFGLGC